MNWYFIRVFFIVSLHQIFCENANRKHSASASDVTEAAVIQPLNNLPNYSILRNMKSGLVGKKDFILDTGWIRRHSCYFFPKPPKTTKINQEVIKINKGH